jgi:hypothetical protein
MMSRSAGLHTDQASGKLAKEVQDLLAPQLTGDDNLARTIHAVNLEYVLGEINADGVNMDVDDPLPVIRCSTITPFAHSMPGAGVVHHINRYQNRPSASGLLSLRQGPACIAGSRFRSNFRSRPMMATKRKPPESGSQIQNLMSRIARPSMLALTSDDTP